MSGFDITFELFTLLLGLAMAELLAGFARAFKLRSRIRNGRGGELEQVRIGWLVPLAAVVVICHQASFWLFMYQMQDDLPLHFLSLICLLALIGGYYLVSAVVWPDEPEAWPDFDAYYMAHRRFIWLGVLAIGLCAELGRTVYGGAAFDEALEATHPLVPYVDFVDDVGSLALLALPFMRSVRWALALLVVLVAHFVVLAAASPVIPM